MLALYLFQDPDVHRITQVAIIIALLVISTSIHEAAHAWVALKCGDPTARDLGRLSLNPVVHIDLFMTILLPAITFLSTGFIFGGAKPVPVNYYNLRHPLRDMALVAIAGPLSNLILAAVFFFFYKVLVFELGVWESHRLGPEVLLGALGFNLLLTTFNLLPIPPLDGSRVMTWLLPSGLREPYMRLESFGLLVVLFVIYFVPGVNHMVDRTMDLLGIAVQQVVTLGGLW
jgi:Zn-dependent protease